MQINFYGNYNQQLKELQREESNLEKYLQDNINSLDNDEVLKINNKLSGIRSTKEEIDQIISGTFF